MTKSKSYCKLAVLGSFILIFSCFAQSAMAQNGWDDIAANDDITARTHFAAMLDKDSTDMNALVGMIYLSEVEGDQLSYKKYVNSLINNHWDENLYELFESNYRLKDSKTLLDKASISERNKIGKRLDEAVIAQYKGEREKAIKEYRKLTGDYQWSVTGPFSNVAGSGYAIAYAPETKPFDQNADFVNDNNIRLKWVACKDRNPDGSLYFDYYLPSAANGVYYANTYITVPSTRAVQFRISRSNPMKIWLDDQLIFANDKEIRFKYDNEWVQLVLPAGTHRLLIKNSDFSGSSDRLSLRNYEKGLGRATALRAGMGADESYYDDEDAGGMSYTSYGSSQLTLRITDTTGTLYQDISTSFTGSYNPQKYEITLSDKHLIRYFHDRIQKNPNDLFAYFALSQAYIKAGLGDEGEEFFVKAYRLHRNSVFFKYVVSQLYEDNSKKEKFYEVLDDIDQSKTPIFSILYQKLEEKDQQNDEDEWLAALKKLYQVSPSNYAIIMKYVHYYDDKGMTTEKDEFIDKTSEKYPVYKSRLKSYLEKEKKENKYKNPSYDSYSDSKNYKLGKYSSYAELSSLKSSGKTKKVIRKLDKLIAEEPYNIQYRTEKAEYLKDKDKFDEAMTELNKALQINPYNKDIYETIGDVYKEKDMKDSAVAYYKKAKHFSLNNSYAMTALDEKIEKVQDQKPLKKLFDQLKFEDVLKDTGWVNKYKDEESVVLMYTRDLVLDEFNHAQLFQKIMIKIVSEAGVNKWTEFNFNFLGNIASAKVIKATGAEVVPDMQGGYAVFKDLKPGDIIQLEGNYSWQPSGELNNELALVSYFTFEAPIYYLKYEVAVQEGRYLGYKHHKLADNTKKYTKNGYDFYKWEYSNVHKVEREEAIMDDYDQFAHIMISTMKDWSKVVSWYSNKTYKKLETSYEIKEILDSIITPGMSQQDKVQAIYNYLTKEIKYSFVPFLQSGYIPKRCGLTLSGHIGDCKDVATVMIAMLRQVGVESYYTLVKTNMFDHQEYLPSQYFDHVVAGYYLNGKLHFADMTTDFYPHYVLTEADANACALLIKDGSTSLFRLPQDNLDTTKSMVTMQIDATLNTNRSLDVQVKAIQPGTEGGDIRERFSRISNAEQKNFILQKIGKGVFQNMTLQDYKFENLKEISQPLRSQYNVSATGFSDKVASLFIFRVPYATAIQSSQAMQSKARYNRLNLDNISETTPTRQIVDVHFPKGYQLVELPEDFNIDSKYGTYKVSYKKIKDGVRVEKYQVFKVTEVTTQEFDAFKDYYFKILEADMTRMAIQKKAASVSTASR